MNDSRISRDGLNMPDGSDRLNETDDFTGQIPVCVKASVAEHARFSDSDDVCDDGR